MPTNPITPPPELVEQWWDAVLPNAASACIKTQLCAKAAQWGADQELEAFQTWLACKGYRSLASDLLAARRPKPPSLKEQALKALRVLPTPAGEVTLDITDLNTIRRALESLHD